MDKLSSAVLFESRQAFPLSRSQFLLPWHSSVLVGLSARSRCFDQKLSGDG